MTETLDPIVTVTPSPDPGPGGRTSRGAGQVGSALVFIELWKAFGWLGADRWNADEAAARWPAITGTAIFLIVAAHNIVNWWTTRNQPKPPPAGVEVRAEAGSSMLVVLLLVLLILVLVGAIR